MGDVINIKTRKHDQSPKKDPIVWFALFMVFVIVAATIAGAIYLMR